MPDNNIAELKGIIEQEDLAAAISFMYSDFRQKSSGWREEQIEKRNFLFATDTKATSTRDLDWNNTTTIPKLTQIRDNLHANYMAALFPNDDWFTWEAHTAEAATKAKADKIKAYMENKVRKGNFRTTVSQLLYDYIDYGNVFADVEYVDNTIIDPMTGEKHVGYIGPKAIRISPMDIVINPVAREFSASPKITRHLWTIGELKQFTEDNPTTFDLMGIAKLEDIRSQAGAFSTEDFEKAEAYSVDGFGNLRDYYQSEMVEIIEFEGSIYDADAGIMKSNVLITIADRQTVLREEFNPSWLPNGTKVHATWRARPDNLYGMGPLDNLVGMQYRIDHLENSKADAVDLNVTPIIVVRGNPDDSVEWKPRAVWNLDEETTVEIQQPDLTALNLNLDVDRLEQKMEEFAGAPREAMGIRTAGEKTAFEVQTLSNAASRIFQEKLDHFEINILEPLLNNMMIVARQEMDASDIVSITDDDLGVQEFITITKADLTEEGKLRPIGARHFAAQQQISQSLLMLSNSALFPIIQPHMSSKNLAVLIEEVLGLKRFDLFSEFIGIDEAVEAQKHQSMLQEDGEVAGTLPPAPEEDLPPQQPRTGPTQ